MNDRMRDLIVSRFADLNDLVDIKVAARTESARLTFQMLGTEPRTRDKLKYYMGRGDWSIAQSWFCWIVGETYVDYDDTGELWPEYVQYFRENYPEFLRCQNPVEATVAPDNVTGLIVRFPRSSAAPAPALNQLEDKWGIGKIRTKAFLGYGDDEDIEDRITYAKACGLRLHHEVVYQAEDIMQDSWYAATENWVGNYHNHGGTWAYVD